ncbi:glyceraldehyde-3-phosphate dehydrogenase (NAD+) [Tindallia magadiensis]|uniref:Glyceraldehyde-3-phosphate dehydrogenase n=1 Tax=Tindallia magadiensis TaxID=69895 RepID=A0A1I3B3Y3_9FIRM|nr:type I glyceraldehyde-3-phosphate dehydrogenase [Tindallia magadiensis]SFH56994.1 glyceraldehyde-3-phosphate dehydrogenase (NAD+) [Tindallia magadiensis]
MATTKVGINGFGRIGKAALKAWLENEREIEIIAINSTSGPVKHAHVFKYDSLYGTLPQEVKATEDKFLIGDKEIMFTAYRNPEEIPWAEMGVEIVLECSGKFTSEEELKKHLVGGAKKVILSAPPKDGNVKQVVMGVNENTYDPAQHHILSNASCTTNCLAPVVKVLNDSFGVEHGLMTTVHAYTNDQNLLDLPHKDPRRSRAAHMSIIPTTTGAAKAVTKVIPELEGRLNGFAMRVPTPIVSVVDFVATLSQETTEEEVNKKLMEAANGSMKGILGYSDVPLVSIDYKKDKRSSIVDGLSTMMNGPKLVKVVSWYDNEWGYSERLIDFLAFVAKKGL